MVKWMGPFATREQKVDPQRADSPISEVPTYAIPQYGAYGVPSLREGSPYNDEFGWSAKLRTSTVEVPSAQRLGAVPRYDYRPDPPQPSNEGFWRKLDADDAKRHTAETQDADGWTEKKGVLPSDRRWKDNPRLNPPPEPRPMLSMAPSTYLFLRPFDQYSARELNGTHFSMADHRRNYEIYGMEPVRSRRNTYRMEPGPWDANIVDMPPEQIAPPYARYQTVELPRAQRSFRL